MKYCKQSIFIVFFSLCTYTLSKIELNEQITTGIISKMIQQKNGVRIGPEKIKVFEEKYPNETLYTLITTLNLNYLPHSLDDYFTDIATEHEKRSFVYLLIKTFFHQKALSGNKTDAFKLDHHTRCTFDHRFHMGKENVLIFTTCFTDKEIEAWLKSTLPQTDKSL